MSSLPEDSKALRAMKLSDEILDVGLVLILQSSEFVAENLLEIRQAALTDALPVNQSAVRAHAIGLLSRQRTIRLIFRAADIFVNTSIEEAFGQMMLEAAACGLPIVAFDTGGVSDIAREGINALLAPVGNTEELIKATEVFVGDGPARERFGNEGRRIAVNEFSLACQAENWTHYSTELAKS